MSTPGGPGSYASRGGLKLDGALAALALEVHGKRCIDVGSSHGGFTDCLLRRGAAEVVCIDVGKGLLDFRLRQDPRVRLMEETNVRWLEPASLPFRADLVTIDVSFISLQKLFAKLRDFLAADGTLLALVKPQFEGTPKEAPGGFVKDEPTRQTILERVRQQARAARFRFQGEIDSPVKGRHGNQETFFHLSPEAPPTEII